MAADFAFIFPDMDWPAERTIRCETGEAVRITAAIKETAAFQVVLVTDQRRAESVTVGIDDLINPIGRMDAGLFRFHTQIPVGVQGHPSWLITRSPRSRRRATYYDALLPIGRGTARDLAIPVEGNLALWIEITVPPGTRPGPYASRLWIEDGGVPSLSIPLELVVYPFALPDRSDLTLLAPLAARPLLAAHLARPRGRDASSMPVRWSPDSPDYEAALSLLHSATRLLAEHRCQPYLSDYYPVVKAALDGSPLVGWEDYDTIVAPFIDGTAYDTRTPARWWPLPVNESFPPAARYGGPRDERYQRFLAAYADLCAAHFRERGWEQSAFVATRTAEIGGERLAADDPLAGLAARLTGGVSVVNPCPHPGIAEYGWRDPPAFPAPTATAVWAPPARYTSREMASRARQQGTIVWLRPSVPPFTGSLSIQASAIDARTLAWQAHLWGASAIWLEPVADWPESVREGRFAALDGPTDRWLIYPGSSFGEKAPIPSLRLKRLRRGAEDYLYLHLLERHHRPHIATLVASSLMRFAGLDACGNHLADGLPFGWVQDPALWSAARRLMAEQIVRAIEGAPPETGESLASHLEWSRFLEACCRVRVLVEGVRLSGDGGSADTGVSLHARCYLQVVNETRRALEGTLSTPGQGPALNPEPSGVRVPAGGRTAARVRVPFQPLPPGTETGHQPLELVLEAQGVGRLTVTSRVAWVVPLRPAAAPLIDGDLADWPAGVGNVAGDFRLVGSGAAEADSPESGPSGDLPSEATTVFVTCDEHNLYFGFRCRAGQMDGLTVRHNNYVAYDGLMPVGEDLIEVVLDPTNAATTDPGDVYHITVKANGAVIAATGVPMDPPIASYRLWTVPITAAVRRHADHWSAELSLPRSAFAGEPCDPHVWAVNFARFHPRTGEYSNWSGAKFQIYNPRSMGNLIWPPAAR